jgi:hypothetical protein
MARNGWVASTIFLAFIFLLAVIAQLNTYLYFFIFKAPILSVIFFVLVISFKWVTGTQKKFNKILRIKICLFKVLNRSGYHIFLFSHFVGWIYKQLGNRWTSPIIRLTDIAILIFLIEWLFVSLANKFPNLELINNSSKSFLYISNASIYLNNASSPNGTSTILANNAITSMGTDIIFILVSNLFSRLTNVFSNIINFFYVLFYNLFYVFSMLFVTIWYEWQKILVVWFFFELIRFVLNTTQRLIIDEVIDNPTLIAEADDGTKASEKDKTKDAKNQPSKGLADLLIIYLNRINELYRVVDEKRAIRTGGGAGKPIEAVMETESLSNALENISVGTSEFVLGPIKIPIGSFTSLAGRVVRGPRIVIGIYQRKQDNRDIPFLAASLTGLKESNSWLVDPKKPLEEETEEEIENHLKEEDRSVENMIEELAHRIFANFAVGKTGKLYSWRASYEFTEGLRAYRDSLLTSKNRIYNLKKAEKEFIQALVEETNFSLAYYHLGVVYTEIGQKEAAESAFLKSIDKDPHRWEAYYALGLNRFDRAERCECHICKIYGFKNSMIGNELDFEKNYCSFSYPDIPPDCMDYLAKEYEGIIMLCEHVIYRIEDIGFIRRDFSTLAKVYNLIGHANRNLWKLQLKQSNPAANGEINEDLQTEIKKKFLKSENNFVLAIGYSWLNLAFSELTEDETESNKAIVSECLIDLADLYLLKYGSDRRVYDMKFANYSKKALEKAICINPADCNLHFKLGEAYCSLDNYVEAAREFEYAAGIAPEKSIFWANIALAYAFASKKERELAKEMMIRKSMRAYERVVIFGADASGEALRTAAKALMVLDGTANEDIASGLRQASMLAELNSCSGEGVSCIYHLARELNKNERLYDEWTYAQLVLALHNLFAKLKKEGCSVSKGGCTLSPIGEYGSNRQIVLNGCHISLEPFGLENYVETAIKRLEEKTYHPRRLNWECPQDCLALARLYLILNKKDDVRSCLDKVFAHIGRVSYHIDTKSGEKIEGWHREYLLEFSFLLKEVGLVYLVDLKDAVEAEKCFKKAISLLEIDYPMEIKRARLRPLIAKSFRQQGKKYYYYSLKEARNAQNLDPLNREELKAIGDAYCGLEEYDRACEAYDLVVPWGVDNNLEDPDVLIRNGTAYLYNAVNCLVYSRRKKILEKALDCFEKAFEIYNRLDLDKRGEARYYMGRVYMELLKYDSAIPHFLIVHNAKIRKEGLIAALRLGQAYLKKHAYEDCEEIYRETIIDWCELIGIGEDDKNEFIPSDPSEALSKTAIDKRWIPLLDEIGDSLNKLVTIDPRDSMPTGQIIAFAMIGLASSYAERDSKLREGLQLVEKAERLTAKLDIEKFREYRIESQAACLDCRGWILYKLDLLGYNQEKTLETYDESRIAMAIGCLEESISLKASSIAYLHLTKAYELELQRLSESDKIPGIFYIADKSKPTIGKSDVPESNLKERAKACCRHAKELDIKEEYSKEIAELEKNLGLVEAEEKPKDPDPSLATLKMDAQGTVSWKDTSKKGD